MANLSDAIEAGSAGRAAVVPRVRAWPHGEVLPLEYHIERMLQHSDRGIVNLFGHAGSGKSTALLHLSAVFGDRIKVVDVATGFDGEAMSGLIVFASDERLAGALAAFEMAAWEEDDVIEYLLHANRSRCQSVMSRVRRAEGRERLLGLPQLWTVVLEEFGSDETLTDVSSALLRHIRREADRAIYDEAALACLKLMVTVGSYERIQLPWKGNRPTVLTRLLRYRVVGIAVTAERLVEELAAGEMYWLSKSAPRELISEAGRGLKKQLNLPGEIERSITNIPRRRPMGISLLLAADAAWRPAEWKISRLSGAYASDARWSGIDLSRCELRKADLTGADLTGSIFDGAIAKGANFRRAKLSGAKLNRCLLTEANLGGADLSNVEAEAVDLEMANLERATLSEGMLDRAMLDRAEMKEARCESAQMRGASLSGTRVERADFSNADLSEAMLEGVQMRDACFRGASFRRARLRRCDLSYLELPMADFAGASLEGSYLTGTIMREANLHGADLRSTGLAEVDWEGSDLRDADFTRASFHMGSSRSGLVKSDIASEGTRTGFYTDDYNDQDFKAPEEIRKANLCGCDLRGASVELTDFYLVDLRGAKYSERQKQHFLGCGAILHARA